MKNRIFYIAYWENLNRKDIIISAENKTEATRKFKDVKGDKVIIQLKEV
jgi:hypothetical protein